jgi:spermidine synthase
MPLPHWRCDAVDVRAYNREVYTRLSKGRHRWTVPVTSAEIAAARKGEWSIQLTDTKVVPAEWFPSDLRGRTVLCLAAGGGQQGPILAAAGAAVTVLDVCPAQLEMDRLVADREALDLDMVVGDMADLSMFADESFDLVILPGANSYIPDIKPLWQEAYRVLRGGGTLLAGFDNPVVYIFDYEQAWRGTLVARYAIPYSDLTSVTEEERRRRRNADIALEFGHSLDDQIGSQIAAGFIITGFFEDYLQDEPSSNYLPNSVATRAVKLGRDAATHAALGAKATSNSPPVGWWYENGIPNTIVQGLRVRTLHSETSPFQRIEILEHEHLGRILALDGLIQVTEADEFVYHEMLVHVPLLGTDRAVRQGRPGSVLIIGGGDGGALREVLRHPWVTRVVMVELDEAVVRCARAFLDLGADFGDPRVTIVFGDGADYVRSAEAHTRPFDVAIVDSCDPDGPSEVLYSADFYRSLSACLGPNGVVCQQLGLPAVQRETFTDGARQLRTVFGHCDIYRAAIPSYIGGEMAFALATRDGRRCNRPAKRFVGRHYNPAVHAAAFALPTWWREALEKKGRVDSGGGHPAIEAEVTAGRDRPK